MDNNFTSNAWLITNTQLYFANHLINPKGIKHSAYGLLDLSNLLNAIVLSDCLVTLPGENQNIIKNKLQDQGLLNELKIDRTMHAIFCQTRGRWNSTDSSLLKFLDGKRDEIADRILETVLAEKNLVVDALGEAGDFSNHSFNTPDFDTGGALLRQNCQIADSLGSNTMRYHNTQLDKRRIQEMYVGAVLYFMVASEYKLNYSPDLLRIPLTSFFAEQIDHRISRMTQDIIRKFDEKVNFEIDNIAKLYSSPFFDINVPAIFSWIMNSCENKDEIIDKAIELRQNDYVIEFRKFINEINHSKTLAEINQKLKLIDEMLHKENKESKNHVITLSKYTIGIVSIAFGNVLELLGFLKEGIPDALEILQGHYSVKRLLFIKNVRKSLDELQSVNQKLNRMFNVTISKEYKDFYDAIMRYQDKYISPIV